MGSSRMWKLVQKRMEKHANVPPMWQESSITSRPLLFERAIRRVSQVADGDGSCGAAFASGKGATRRGAPVFSETHAALRTGCSLPLEMVCSQTERHGPPLALRACTSGSWQGLPHRTRTDRGWVVGIWVFFFLSKSSAKQPHWGAAVPGNRKHGCASTRKIRKRSSAFWDRRSPLRLPSGTQVQNSRTGVRRSQ